MEKTEERKKQSWDGMFYSIQRIDLLIVSICGGGIYVCLETVKYLAGKHYICSNLIKLCGAAFLVGIILNFLSQHYGLKANREDYFMCQSILDSKKEGLNKSEKDQLILDIDNLDKKSESYSKCTIWFNNVSMYAMFLGLVLIFIFFVTTF